MIEFEKPNIECLKYDEKTNYARFVCEPLEKGYGTTLGNSMRRIMLSSLPGAAITGIIIDGIQHEFTTIPNIVEDVMEIILNLKSIRFKKYDPAPITLNLKFKGAGEIKAKDIKEVAGIEIINKDLYIATASEGANLNIQLLIENGRGYHSAEENEGKCKDINFLPIDSIFTPVTKVNYTVEPTRVGNSFDFDKLTIDIWTDGSIEPKEALSMASRVMITHLELFKDLSEFTKDIAVMLEPKPDETAKLYSTPVSDLGLTKRPLNCLKIQSIETLGQLLSYTKSEVTKFKNLGKKSLQEIEEMVEKLELKFKEEDF